MNMPVLPVTNPGPPPTETAARTADADSSSAATPAFSNVLSQQKGQAPTGKDATQPSRTQVASQDADKTHDPVDPDATLTLILNSAALPLMQVPPNGTAANPQSLATAATTSTPSAKATQAATPLLAIPAAAERLVAADATQAIITQTGPEQLVQTPATSTTASGNSPEQALLATVLTTSPKNAAHGPAQVSAAQPAKDTADTAQLWLSHTDNTPVPAADAEVANLVSHDTPHTASSDASGALPAFAGAPVNASLLTGQPAPATNPVVTLAVSTPMGSPQWPQDLSRQIVAFAQSGVNGIHTIQLHVNPPDLGPVHITLQVGDASTQAAFMSPNAHVRQALQNALPNLEQQFAQAGLSLGQASVGDQQAGQQNSGQSSSSSSGRSDGSVFSLDATDGSVPLHVANAQSLTRHPDGLVDTFV